MKGAGLSIDDIDMPPFDPSAYEVESHARGGVNAIPGEKTGSGIMAAPFLWCDPTEIPLRKWIYGRHYIRRFVYKTVAPGGIGKYTHGIGEAHAIVSGRDLLGIQPNERTNVWLWNGEDPLEELQRRIMATAMHFGLSPDDVEGGLFVNSGRDTEIVIAEQTNNGTVICRPVVEAVMRTIKDNRIGLVIIDPFVSSHRVTENDNNAIDRVAKTWAKIAEETGCAVELVHHSRKTGGWRGERRGRPRGSGTPGRSKSRPGAQSHDRG
jgi:RecA-family ATPase